MKWRDEFNGLVIVGAWNKSIFNPTWVSKYLLPDEKLEAEVPLGVDAFFKISSKKVRIFVLGNKLNFVPISKTDENFDFCSRAGTQNSGLPSPYTSDSLWYQFRF